MKTTQFYLHSRGICPNSRSIFLALLQWKTNKNIIGLKKEKNLYRASSPRPLKMKERKKREKGPQPQQ
jgi:hypothetical protein